ncbi:MAG: sugar transferase [Clostridium sp.]|uniref:sugar transferase n=1 Tax=Clostridium sp. TaxID=1506 RepID=UPI002903C266|nr:sugar transferase [Clostridium sp.]MDU1978903.1 sugar transferase [Clostridium sp.]MDU1994333.1 sugar transferase [Clostridium sp.]MDU6048912.1 sugar transferase [Clostridium sp.]MDU6223029.1 sugar transferase [Clostridium sp.]MDU6273802.1 sugar transferase [Clostridium sp.]
MLIKWEKLPKDMQTPEVYRYYNILAKRKGSLIIKRAFDIVASIIMLIIFAIPMLVIALLITIDSPGGVFYRQVRITQYGREFRIHKFRTMVANADKMGSLVTVGEDSRITKIGAFLRKYRLDEIPQLLDVLAGTMSYVGARPEVPKYVNQYTDEMKATLLLPAGITSEASIRYKDEAKLLESASDVDRVYVEQVLAEKMKYNLIAIENFNLFGEVATMLRTVFAVLGKEYDDYVVDLDDMRSKVES